MKKAHWGLILGLGWTTALSGTGVTQGSNIVSTGGGYNNSGDRGANHGWTNANGPILPTAMSSWFWFEPADNPQPGNAGILNVSISAQGDFIPNNGTITPAMEALAQNPISTGGTFQINEITVKQDGEWVIYNFDPTLAVSWSSRGSFYLDPEGLKHRGYLDADVWVNGAAFTDVRSNFQINEWTGEGPRPDWLADWESWSYFSGIVTPTSVTVIPEPATAALLAIGGGSLLLRRKKSRERNLIA